MNEIWKDIIGYEGYYKINPQGEIISIKRKGVASDRLLKKHDSHGYIAVSLTKNKKYKMCLVHRLLYENFIGKLNKRLVIDHIDNDKLNNSLHNLQQISIRENATKDRFRKKTTSKYLGVSWCKVKCKWRSTIYTGLKRKHIGYYEKELDAYNAYLKESKILSAKASKTSHLTEFEKEIILTELKSIIKKK